MREIIFRGKRIDNGEWVYGSLINNAFQKNDKTPLCYIFDVNAFGYYDCWEDIAATIDEFEVFPESVGKFSTLHDKNGKEIYEDDILSIKIESGEVWNVVCKFGTIQRKMDTGWLVDITGFYFERPDGLNSLPIVRNYCGKHDLEMMEIVGNLFETP